jgi:hypothetical protein
MRQMRNAHKILVGKLEGKTTLGRPRRRWEDNYGIDLRETGWKNVDWMHLDQDKGQWRDVGNMKMNLQIPQKEGNFLTDERPSASRRVRHGIGTYKFSMIF